MILWSNSSGAFPLEHFLWSISSGAFPLEQFLWRISSGEFPLKQITKSDSYLSTTSNSFAERQIVF